uniref:Uncharacterized protein n=1 Tax=Leersia perrieri TaxID=77586 RepID=A0A0D9VCP9_9ORYZ
MAEGRGGVVAKSSSSSAVARRCGCGLGRLVRRLRRQAALCAARPATASRLRRGSYCQYDPLSYARNFDGGGDDGAAAAQLYYSYTFSSRFVLPSSSSAARASTGRAPAAASH